MAWNRSGSGGKTGVVKKSTSKPRILVVASLAAIFAGVVGWFALSRRSVPPDAPLREPRPAAIPQAKPAKTPVAEVHVAATNAPVVDPKKQIAPGYRHPSNPNLPRKKYFPTVEEVERARLGPDGKPRKMSIYKTPLEQSLGILFTTKLGSPPPMLPSIPSISTPERLQKFFDTAMVYDKDAPKEVNENRMMMQQVKDELKRYLDEGGTASRFVEYYQNELRVAHEEWKMAQKMLIDMSRGGEDASVMREFRDKANAILAERGIKPLAVPPFVRQSMGEE